MDTKVEGCLINNFNKNNERNKRQPSSLEVKATELSRHRATYMNNKFHRQTQFPCNLTDGNMGTPGEVQKAWDFNHDCCWNKTAEQLDEFFLGAKSTDILIFSVGLPYAMNMIEGSDVDYEAWLTDSARNFQRAVNKYFPGRIFRVTLSQLRDSDRPGTSYTHYILETEKILSKVFIGEEDPKKKWFTIDQWAINEHRLQLYNDYVHFQGPLVDATLNNIFSEFCPK